LVGLASSSSSDSSITQHLVLPVARLDFAFASIFILEQCPYARKVSSVNFGEEKNALVPPFEKSLYSISILALTNEVNDVVVKGSVVEFTISFGPFVLIADCEACLCETDTSQVLSTSIKI